MRCFERDGKIHDLRFGQAMAGWAFDRIEISMEELRGMDDQQMWDYIRLVLFCRLVPGGTLTIVQGPPTQKESRRGKMSDLDVFVIKRTTFRCRKCKREWERLAGDRSYPPEACPFCRTEADVWVLAQLFKRSQQVVGGQEIAANELARYVLEMLGTLPIETMAAMVSCLREEGDSKR